MPYRYEQQERENIAAAEARSRQQSALNASLAAKAAVAACQPLDADLTAISGLTPANDDILQRKAGAWTNRTPAQVKTDLALAKGDVGLGNVDNTTDAGKPVSTATQTALNAKMATWVAAPASAASTGVAGSIAYDSGFLYVAVATDTWVRAALATW